MSEFYDEQLIRQFMVETDSCSLCGTQRCERTPIWVSGCSSFKKWAEDKGVCLTTVDVAELLEMIYRT